MTVFNNDIGHIFFFLTFVRMVEDIKFLLHSYEIIPPTLKLASQSIRYGCGYVVAFHVFGFLSSKCHNHFL